MSGALADLTSPQARCAAASALLLVPLGATEQHGPHLPLSTDTEIALALATALAQRREALVAPPIAYGASGEHQAFAGTISVGQEALRLFLIELVRSASTSFGRILLICAHGGNRQPVAQAVGQLRKEGRAVRAFFPCFGGDAHAGRCETSIMLSVRPAAVDLATAAPGNDAPLRQLMPVMVREGVHAVSPNGVLGNPAGASAEQGEALLCAALADLEALLDDWEL